MVQADVWLDNQTLVPTINFGLIAERIGELDVLCGELPRSVNDRSPATRRACTAMLTGRIASIQGDARI